MGKCREGGDSAELPVPVLPVKGPLVTLITLQRELCLKTLPDGRHKFQEISVPQVPEVSSLIWCGLVFEFLVLFFSCRHQKVNQD